MSYFPFFIDITDAPCLVVGGGAVAYRKVEALLPFSPNIMVVAPRIEEELWGLQEQNLIKCCQREIQNEDIKGMRFAIAATNDNKLNQEIFKLCNEEKILVNVVDQSELCGFYFPSIVKKGELVVGVSSGGNSPTLAKETRKKIEGVLPDFYETLNEQMSQVRNYLKTTSLPINIRANILEAIYQKSEAEGRVLSKEEIKKIIDM